MERMRAKLAEKVKNRDPDAVPEELTPAQKRLNQLDTELYDVQNVINKEGSVMSDRNLSILRDKERRIVEEQEKLKDPRIKFADDPELLDQLSVENQNDAMLAKLRSEDAIPVEEVERLKTFPVEDQNSILKTKTLTRRDAKNE